MSARRTAARRDQNEPDIIAALHAVGASVTQLSDRGVPDLLVGFRGRTVLMEVKTAKGTLTEDQRAWHDRWHGEEVRVVRSTSDALRAIGLTTGDSTF